MWQDHVSELIGTASLHYPEQLSAALQDSGQHPSGADSLRHVCAALEDDNAFEVGCADDLPALDRLGNCHVDGSQRFQQAAHLGISTGKVVATAFPISGLLSGISGVLLTSQRVSDDLLQSTVPPLENFIAVVPSGAGSLIGAMLAAASLTRWRLSRRPSRPTQCRRSVTPVALRAIDAILPLQSNGMQPAQTGRRS
ncbi:MAG: ABC transporter permease subunit [Cypionkella sp.]